VPDIETGEFAGGGLDIGTLVANVAEESLPHFAQEFVQLVRLAFRDQFDPAIRLVPHIAAYGVAMCDRTRGIAESDALHASRILHGPALYGGAPFHFYVSRQGELCQSSDIATKKYTAEVLPLPVLTDR
jgi:hypothetical protein